MSTASPSIRNGASPLPDVVGLGGAIAGLIGGLAMALVGAIISASVGGDIWLEAKQIAAVVYGSAVAAQPGFEAGPVLVGTLLHLLVSTVLGALFGIVTRRIFHLTSEFGTLLMAYASTIRDDTGQLAMVERLVVVPLTLFSGTFFPLSELPWFLQWIGWLSPLWHGTELSRVLTFGYPEPIWLTVVHVVVLVGMTLAGWVWARRIAVRRLTA